MSSAVVEIPIATFKRKQGRRDSEAASASVNTGARQTRSGVASTQQRRVYQTGTHAGFPAYKVVLWVASREEVVAAAKTAPSQLDAICIPAASTVEAHLEAQENGGYTAIECGTLVATCIPEDIEFPQRHQAVFGLLATASTACAAEEKPSPSLVAGKASTTLGAAHSVDWLDVRRQVLGDEGVRSEAHTHSNESRPLVELSLMPGNAAGKPAKFGTFSAGVVVDEKGVRLAANNTVVEGPSQATDAARCAALAALVACTAEPLHRIHVETHSRSHCAMLEAQSRADARPRLTLGSEHCWSATQLELSITRPLPIRARPTESFTAWSKASHDDDLLPSFHVSLPSHKTTTSLVAHHQGAVVSALGFYFVLPLAHTAVYVMQRAFPYIRIPPRSTPRNLGIREEHKSCLTLSFSADARLVRDADKGSRAHCLVCAPRKALGVLPGLASALGSVEKAKHWEFWHVYTCFIKVHCSTDKELVRDKPDGIYVKIKLRGRPRAKRELAHADSKAAFATDETRGSLSGWLDRDDTSSSRDGDEGCSSATNVSEALSSREESQAEAGRPREFLHAQAKVDGASVASVSSSGKRYGPALRQERQTKRLMLGPTPEQLLMLTLDAPTEEDHGRLVVSELPPGPLAMQSIVDQRIATMSKAKEDDTIAPQQAEPSAASVEEDDEAGLQSMCRQFDTLSECNRQNGAVALKHRIEIFTAAFTFYENLRAYCARLASRAGEGRLSLPTKEGNTSAAVVDLVQWIDAKVNTSAVTSCVVPPHLVESLLSSVPVKGAPPEAWLRLVPSGGLGGRRSKSFAIQLPLFDILLHLWGAEFAQVLGSEHAERDGSIMGKAVWPLAVRRMELRIDIIKMFHEAHNKSHCALALPGVCALVSHPPWFFQASCEGSFFDTRRGYRLPKEWSETVAKGIKWSQSCDRLHTLFELTMQAPKA